MKSLYQYSQIFDNEHLESVSANGSVLISNSTVKNTVSVNGALSLKESNVGKVNVNGRVDADGSFVYAESMINGSLNAIGSKFGGIVSIASEKTVFKNCEIDGILVRKYGEKTPVQIVELLGDSVVREDIVFECSGGEVITSRDAIILGKIVGGSIRSK
jgi:hypothetical protein